VEIQVGGRSVVNKNITQSIEVRPEGQRFLRLSELLGEWYENGKGTWQCAICLGWDIPIATFAE